jgi:hypothetical protein
LRRPKYLYQCQVRDCHAVYTSTRLAVIHEKATGHHQFKIMEEGKVF